MTSRFSRRPLNTSGSSIKHGIACTDGHAKLSNVGGMVTVPANDLILRTIKPLEAEPRMPAILDDAGGGDAVWATWLGEYGATADAAKALLKTMEGVNWTTAPEPKKPRPRKP